MTQPAPVSERAIKKAQIEMLSMSESFFQSSVLFALAKLRIFERIGEERRSVSELAAELDAQPATLARLLNAGVYFNLLETEDGLTFQVAPVYRTVLLPSAGEHYLGDGFRGMDHLRSAMARLDEAVLNSSPTVEPSAYVGADEESTREYILTMHNYAFFGSKELAHFLDTSGCESLLDLGCGPGTYAIHLGMKNPKLALYLVDRPEVLEITREIRARFPLENEIHYLPLDVTVGDIPGTYDLILASNLLHMLGEKDSRALVKRLYKSLNQGGSLVIQARYLQDNRLGDVTAVFLDLLQLCITPNGRNHSVQETRDWLEEAGFTDIEYSSMTILNAHSFLRGYKP